jgi:hypothetical protein
MMKKRNTASQIFLGTCLLALVSCGSDDDTTTVIRAQEQQQDDQGIYRAVLRPMNATVATSSAGTVEVRIEGDDVVVESTMIGTPAGVKHLQNIMTSTSCPEATADINNDSFVDVVEALPVTGPILIPLDSNLSSQLTGIDFGPIANSSGSYVYRRSTTLTGLLADLRAPDPDPTDSIVKLPLEQDLNLAGRVVLVHGVANSANLPDSVASIHDLPSEQTLPIACGQLVRIENEDEAEPTPEETPEPSPEETPEEVF